MRSNMGGSASGPRRGGRQVYDQMKRHEVHVLRHAGFPLREVARRAEISLDTVERILRESNGLPQPPRAVGRPMVASSFEAAVQQVPLGTSGPPHHGDPPSDARAWILGGEGPPLSIGPSTAEDPPRSSRPLRGAGRRVLAERLRLGPCPLRRRDRGDPPLLREPTEVVPLDLRPAGPRREGRVARPGPPRRLRRLRGRSPGLRLRQSEDGRDLPPRRPDPMERHLRSGRARLPVRPGALYASEGPGEGRRRELGRVLQEELLPGPTVPRPRRPRGAARAVAPRGERGPPVSGDRE